MTSQNIAGGEKYAIIMMQNLENEESELKFENSVMPLSYNKTTTPVNQSPKHDTSINQVVISIDRDDTKNTMNAPDQKLDTNKEKMGILKSFLSSNYIKKYFACICYMQPIIITPTELNGNFVKD